MRKLSLLSLAAALLLMSVGMSSCSDADDLGQGGGSSKEQKDDGNGGNGEGEGGDQEGEGGDQEGGGEESDAPVSIANVSAGDVGKVIASDKYVYSSAASAQAAGVKICAVVAYVGNDTGEENYRHGLAISMKNFNGNGFPWKNTYGVLDNPTQYNLLSEAIAAKESGYSLTHKDNRHQNSYTWSAFFYAYNNTVGSDEHITILAPASTSGWFLPSIYQWNQIINGLNNNEAKLTTSDNASLSMFYANEKLKALGAEEFRDGAYWSSTEYDENNAWLYWANYGKASDKTKNWNFYVRSVLAF